MGNNYVGFFYAVWITQLNLGILIYLPLLDANKWQSCNAWVYLQLFFTVDSFSSKIIISSSLQLARVLKQSFAVVRFSSFFFLLYKQRISSGRKKQKTTELKLILSVQVL